MQSMLLNTIGQSYLIKFFNFAEAENFQKQKKNEISNSRGGPQWSNHTASYFSTIFIFLHF